MKTLRDPKLKPTHPGEIFREDVLPALDMSQEELRWLRMQEAVDLFELELDPKRYRHIEALAA